MSPSWLVNAFRNLFRRDTVERELDEELHSYIDLLTEEKAAAGLPEQLARSAAQAEVGGVERVKEEVREQRAGVFIERLLQDARYGLRMALRTPTLTGVIVVTLGIGIGATTAVFSVVDTVLLNPLPFPNANRIVTLWQLNRTSGGVRDDVAPANFLDWKDRSTAFEAIAAIEPAGFEYLSDGEPQNLRAWRVSEGFFEIFGIRPLGGRTFTAEEYRPGTGSTVVLSHGFWEREFGKDIRVLGDTMILGGRPYVIAGVMPPEFDFPPGRDLWVPRAFTEQDRQLRARTYLNVIALLKAGQSVDSAAAELQGLSLQLAREYPATNGDVGAVVVPVRDHLVGQVRPYLVLLTGAVALVLLISCVNVANLLLARGAARISELAVRSALGAPRERLFSQLFLESLILALLGGAFGLVVGYWGLKALIGLAPGDVPRLQDARINMNVLAFAATLSCVTAIVFGMLPAKRFAKLGASATALREGPRGSGRATSDRTRRYLVISEIALALTLLAGASLLLRSFVNLLQVDPGFSARNVVAMPVFVWTRYPTEQQRAEFFRQTLQRLEGVPGVVAAAAVSTIPFGEELTNTDTGVMIEGRPTASGALPTARVSVATSGYFRAMGIAIEQGRGFGPQDTAGAVPVTAINQSMARRFWPDENPLGKRLRITSGPPSVTWEIIGVVRDTRESGLDSNPRPALFIPHEQYPLGSMTYVVRTTVDPASMIPSLKAAVWAINQELPFRAITTVEQLVAASIAPRQFVLVLMGAFGAVGLFLAAVGLFGIVNYFVTQRTQEIGLRIALGAAPRSVVQLLVGEGIRLTGVGVLIGLLGAVGLTQVLSGLLFGVRPTDPLAFAGAIFLVLIVAGVASYLPARRAARLSPMVALRTD